MRISIQEGFLSWMTSALQIRLDAVESRGGVKADLQVEGTENLEPRARQELYQVAQEALNNTLKHARARSVRVTLAYGEDATRLEVRDDGCGLQPQRIREALVDSGWLLAGSMYGWVIAATWLRPLTLPAPRIDAQSALGYALLPGVWTLLIARLMWGLGFAAMNIATQALATHTPEGAPDGPGDLKQHPA